MDATNDECKVKFEELCRELNMDRETEELSWNKYIEVSQRFSLEGDPVHWFCCSLFAACGEIYTPTVGAPNATAVVRGNCVSRTKLLRSCNISIYEFFSKIKIWHEMANLPRTFIAHIDRLERTFSITFHLFKHYNAIFEQLFLTPKVEFEKKEKKFRTAKCSSNQLYDLCWCLYLCAKNENPSCTVDLVTSFHLLICCIDLIYVNVLAENRIDLINPDFEGVPKGWNTPEFSVNCLTDYCIIKPLCRISQALPEEAKSMKDTTWKTIMKEFFVTNTICGNESTFLEIVSNGNFERNLRSFNSSYEQYVLSVGEFDERILLNNPNYRKVNHFNEVNENDNHQDITSLIPETPLTRKNSLPNNDSNVKEPVANATNNVMKLQDIADIKEPTEFVRNIGEECMIKLNELLQQLLHKFEIQFQSNPEAQKRFHLAKSLYFYLLDIILKVEVRTKPNVDLKQLLQTDVLNTTLFACCIEIVLDAYNTQLKFPWILKCFGIDPFHFCKIIEIVVSRHDGILTRALIKHLNFIEETCLETLAWQKKSPIWELINNFGSPLPTWSEVELGKTLPSTIQPSNIGESARRDLFNAVRESADPRRQQQGLDAGNANRRTQPLRIFLRKFYKLAWLRIKELCCDIDMGDEVSLKKIWTLFEYSITQRYELMQDRHLDQMLMCAIYLYIKVAEINGKTFTDIMKFYRNQPQAKSSTYREILIEAAGEANEEQVVTDKSKYKDIIYFYNNIYVQKMTPYALNFSIRKRSENDLLLSPHPTEKPTFPKKLSSNHHLYIYPLEKNEVSNSPNQLTWEFSKSPGKELQKMNDLARKGGKRTLAFDNEMDVDRKISRKPPHYFYTIKNIIEDRQEKHN